MIRVMLIEREELYQRTFAKIIEKQRDYELVALAENGMDALNLMEQYRPQMVFAEVLLGKENGIDVCRGIKERYPETTTYILSSYCNIELMKNAVAAGVEQYLVKPMDAETRSSLFTPQIQENTWEDIEHYHLLMEAIEGKKYRDAYEVCRDYATYIFDKIDLNSRKRYLKWVAGNLFYIIPGMDVSQKDYYFQKYQLNNKIIRKEVLCYCWLVAVVTEVFRQICVMKYTHMNRVFQYVENNLKNEISLHDMAEDAGISSGYLSRILKKYYGIGVVDFIHLRKIVAAKEYIASSDMSIADIAYELGYSEAGYFCKIFKKYENMTPSAFHNQYV